jgi:hypothetical protein
VGQYRNKIDHLEGTAWVKSLIDELHPARVNIDAGNIGAAIVTGLKSLGPHYAKIVRGVNFGGTARPRWPSPRSRGRKTAAPKCGSALLAHAEEGPSLPDDGRAADRYLRAAAQAAAQQ